MKGVYSERLKGNAQMRAKQRIVVRGEGLVGTAPVDKPGQPAADVWLARAAEAMDSVVRKSLEMRVVALLLPNCWPFNRSARG